MPRRKKNDFLDIEIYHFSRRESAPYRNPVEMYAYILSNYISLSNQTYCIGPRSSAYLVACNEPDEDHRVGDGKCDYLAPQQVFSNFQQYSEQRVINAILVMNVSRKEKIYIRPGISMQMVIGHRFADLKQVEIPELLVDTRARY